MIKLAFLLDGRSLLLILLSFDEPNRFFIDVENIFIYSGWITCRQVLNIMVIFGFMLNYALRVNLTIAIGKRSTPKRSTKKFQA